MARLFVADGQPVPPEQVNLFFRVTIDIADEELGFTAALQAP